MNLDICMSLYSLTSIYMDNVKKSYILKRREYILIPMNIYTRTSYPYEHFRKLK